MRQKRQSRTAAIRWMILFQKMKSREWDPDDSKVIASHVQCESDA